MISNRSNTFPRVLLPWALAAIVLGALFRFTGLGHRDFWFDESCTFIFVHNLFAWDSLSNLLIESTNLPYYFLLRVWTILFGESEWAYRSFSACCATAAIPLTGWLGWQLAGRRVAVITMLIAGFHPLHIYYAHEARAYAMWTMVIVLCLNLVVRAVRLGTRRGWAAYALTLYVCLHLHYFTVFLVPSLACAALFGNNRRQSLLQWCAATGLTCVAFIPYILVAVLPAGRGGGSAWIADNFDPVTAIPRTIWAFMPSGGYPVHLKGLSVASYDTLVRQSPVLVALCAALPSLLAVALLVRVVMRHRKRMARAGQSPDNTEQPNRYASDSTLFLLATTVIPLLLPLLYSIVIRPVYLPARYDLVAWPSFIVLLAALLDAAFPIRSTNTGFVDRYGTAVATCMMLACSLLPIARMRGAVPESSFHQARAKALARQAEDGSLAITFSYDWEFLAFYLQRAGYSGELLAFPTWLNHQIGWLDHEDDFRKLQRGEVDENAHAVSTFLGEQLSKGTTVFVLGDSLTLKGGPGRTAVNHPLIDRLSAAPFNATIIDRQFLIWRLTRADSSDDK